MIISRYSILDRKSSSFSPSFEAVNDDVAKRLVVSSLNAENSMVLYPADYVLVKLCDFDMETGETIKLSGSFIHEVSSLVSLVPDKLKKFNLDGSFENA